MKSYYFISGLPRSGSTLLSSILQQNPDFHADTASKLATIADISIDVISNSPQNLTINEIQRKNILNGIFDGYYKHINKQVIFDSGREWTSKTFLLKELFPYTKIICCVRDIVSILNSFEIIFSKNPLYKNKILKNGFDVYSRCNELMNIENGGVISIPLLSLNEGYSANSEMILLVKYEDICLYPEKTMKKIYEFIEKPYYNHDFDNVNYSNENLDLSLNVKNLHTVKTKVEYNPPRIILPPEIVKKYSELNLEFWK